MASKVPSINPLWAQDMICSTCGNIMEKHLDRTAGGRVQQIIYRCVNGQTGCSYETPSDVKAQGMSRVYNPPVEKK